MYQFFRNHIDVTDKDSVYLYNVEKSYLNDNLISLMIDHPMVFLTYEDKHESQDEEDVRTCSRDGGDIQEADVKVRNQITLEVLNFGDKIGVKNRTKMKELN